MRKRWIQFKLTVKAVLEIIAVKAIINGFVQGVGYRYYTHREADRLGITGYVKNLPNGNVEVFGEGEEKRLKEFVVLLKSGPNYSQVDKVDVQWMKGERRYKSFKIAYS